MTVHSKQQRLGPVLLLDLPAGWLAWLILAVEKEADLRVLNRSCHKLHELVFSQAALVPTISFEFEDMTEHDKALAMAEAVTSNLHVSLNAIYYNPNLLRTKWVDACTRAASLHAQHTVGEALHPAPVPYQLQCVTKGTLAGSMYDQDLHLDSLVPDFLVQGCPNLRELTLDRVTIAAAPASASPTPTCTSLRKLSMCRLHFPGDVPTAAVKQQLLNLPSITSLHIEGDLGADVQAGSMYHAACDRYSSQLRELRVLHRLRNLPWSPGTVFPHLQHLALSRFSVDSDALMQQLMQAACSVVKLRLGTIQGLNTSFAQERCSWQELTLADVYVDQLAKLPLASCTRVVCGRWIHTSSKTGPKPTAEQVAAGVAAVQAVGGLQFTEVAMINLHIDDLHIIPTAGPLLEHLRELAYLQVKGTDMAPIFPWSEAQSVLAALGQHLRCTRLSAWPDWADTPGAFAQLPLLLPHVLGFDCPKAPDAELVDMCRTATRPFTLHLYSKQAHLKQQMKQAMLKEAGHQLVTVKLIDPWQLVAW